MQPHVCQVSPFCVRLCECKQVTLVGKVVSFQQQHTQGTLILDDSTGPKMSISVWRNDAQEDVRWRSAGGMHACMTAPCAFTVREVLQGGRAGWACKAVERGPAAARGRCTCMFACRMGHMLLVLRDSAGGRPARAPGIPSVRIYDA